MIDERIDLLDLINVRLAELVANNDINENEIKFARLCTANRRKVSWDIVSITHLHAINVALECLRDGVENGILPKGISYNLITIINEMSVVKYYRIIAHEKRY